MEPDEICAIILFGSHARSEGDQFSDVDICTFTKSLGTNVARPDLEHLLPHHGISLGIPLTILAYPEPLVQVMLGRGSLFLWHLKTEGVPLYGKTYFDTTLMKLKPFSRHREELLEHQQLLQDVKANLQRSPVNELDMATLFTIVRNTCMIVAHKFGGLAFGRRSAFTTAVRLCSNLPFSAQDYQLLETFKLKYERGYYLDSSLPTIDVIRRLLRSVENVVEYALERT